jgi:hypothetical protein
MLFYIVQVPRLDLQLIDNKFAEQYIVYVLILPLYT